MRWLSGHLTSKPSDLSSVARTYMVEGDFCKFFSDLCMCAMILHPPNIHHAHIHTLTHTDLKGVDEEMIPLRSFTLLCDFVIFIVLFPWNLPFCPA